MNNTTKWTFAKKKKELIESLKNNLRRQCERIEHKNGVGIMLLSDAESLSKLMDREEYINFILECVEIKYIESENNNDQ